MRLLLLGPPGAGKGTQAKRLAERYGAVHIASGDLFRRHLQEGTLVGKAAESYMEVGDLVPDDLTVRMVIEELQGVEDGFILDGFPRNVAQATALDRELQAAGRPLSAALALNVDEEEVTKRIAGRRVCEQCQRPYNVAFNPPRVAGVCDVCGGRLVQRPDEDEETVRHRLTVYREMTLPLLKFYAERGILREIDASGPEDKVTERAVATLGDTADSDP